jgi:hypothetical protein
MDTIQNQIADKLKAAFFESFGFNPSKNELNSWRNSLRAMGQVMDYSGLRDHGVILEYQLPLSSLRLDCLISGRDEHKQDHAVIVELKQWENSYPADGEREVLTWVGGSQREVLHPSVQAGQYCEYLREGHTAFYEAPSPVELAACSYLHNYSVSSGDALLDDKFAAYVNETPLFSGDDVDPLRDFLRGRLSSGDGTDVLRRIDGGRYRPSKKLMEHVSAVILGHKEFTLLDEQLVAYDRVLASARKGFHDKKTTVILIRGGPGTGKSVIAINLMAGLLRENFNTHYATGSRAFTETLKKVIGPRGSAQFKYFNSYRDADLNAVDVLICDEAHRIRENSRDRFRPKARKSERAQIDELIRAGQVCVFFIDDDQVVRPGEIGSSQYIRKAAVAQGCAMHEYELDIQFRCSGSDAFVKWIENTLNIRRTAHAILSGSDGFDFRIFDSPQSLEKAIRARAGEGNSARITAGFCWEWSKETRSDGTLREDVVIGPYHRPWNARPEARRLARGIPKATLWAYHPGGMDQVGCIYTAQGFEFDYVGVIFGPDLVYDFDQQDWKGDPGRSGDPVVRRSPGFVALVKNTYRVLLSRGLKGCYVYFMDKSTERFFKSRMEKPRAGGSSEG